MPPSIDSSLIFVLFIFGAIVIFILIILGMKAAAKRRQELLQLALELGLTYSIDDPFNIPDVYAHFDWLSQGHDRNASSVIYGQLDGYDIKCFDYEYETDSTSTDSDGHTTTSHNHHHFSAVIVDTDVVFTQLLIRPEGFFDRVASSIGFNDIDFESDEFSRAYYVKSPDKRFAYDVVHQRMMEYLLEYKGWSVQLSGRSIMLYNGCVLSPENYRKAIGFIRGFVAQFPDYLWERLRGAREV